MDKLELGSCVKNIEKEVISQNDVSVKICGDMVGKICDKGCMSSYAPTLGMTLIKNSELDNTLLDAVVINDGKTLTTLLYPIYKTEEQIENEKKLLLSFGLSKSEIKIFTLVMSGVKNITIQKELFISKATLKTHLNNIYKKLPLSYQQFKKRR